MKLFQVSFLLLLLFLFVPSVILAQKIKTITGVIVQEISENKWSAIVIKLGAKKYGIQIGFNASVGDNMDGVNGFATKVIGDISKGKTVQVFYTKVDNTFDYDGVTTWLTATKIVEVKKLKTSKRK
jgi:hypothetical protein